MTDLEAEELVRQAEAALTTIDGARGPCPLCQYPEQTLEAAVLDIDITEVGRFTGAGVRICCARCGILRAIWTAPT